MSSSLSEADEELLRKVKEDEIEYIRFERCDLYSRSIGKLIPVAELKNVLLNGLPMPKPSFGIGAGYLTWYINDSYHNTANVSCFPYHSTYRKLPPLLCKHANIARIQYYPTFGIDDLSANKTLFNVDPRTLCLQQIMSLHSLFGFDIFSAFEYEFTMFKQPKTPHGELVPLWEHKHFANNLSLAQHNDFIFDCERSLRSMGAYLETMHLEYGPGSYEWTVKPAQNMDCADNAFLHKSIIKEIAMKRGWIASFSTTPQCDATSGCSNGAHFNHSLWRDGKNVFYDANSADKLSLTAKYWIGGILKHIEGITCFSVPTINCFRRIRNHSWAPANASWGYNNRTAMIRVKRGGEKGTYFEYRLPCCASNPYLVVASVIIAGMDGIKNKILPYCPPCNDDVFAPHNKDKFHEIPQCLNESLEALLQNEVVCKQFGDMFIESYVATKRMEIESFEKLTESLDGNPVAAETRMFSKL